MNTNWRGHWRAKPKLPVAGLPIAARSAGIAECVPHWRIPNTNCLEFINIYWCYKGMGRMRYKGREFSVEEGDVVVALTGESIDGTSLSSPWYYRWLTCDGERARGILQSMKLVGKMPMRAGECPHALFMQLERQLINREAGCEYEASLTLYSILLRAAQGIKTEKQETQADLASRAEQILRQRFQNPAHDINELAALLHTHRSIISRKFVDRYKRSPSEYLQTLRLEKALLLLTDSNLPVKQVANLSGFHDASYFTRMIKQKFQCTPKELRLYYRET